MPADAYDAAYDAHGADGYALRSRRDVTLAAIGHGPGAVLDAGMGPGRLLADLAARGWTVSGVDAAPAMVRVARKRLPGALARLHEGTIESLPFDDASFDAVVATGVLEYAQLEPALAELARVLRPGGVAAVSYPNPRAVYGVWKTRVYYPTVRAAKRAAGRPVSRLPHGSPLVDAPRFLALLRGAGLNPDDPVPTSYLLVPSPVDLLAPRASERIGRGLERARWWPGLLATQVVFPARRR
jgi:SAM-dependent methyltransferase